MPFVIPSHRKPKRAPALRPRATRLSICFAIPALLLPAATHASALLHDVEFGDTVDYVSTLPEGFDCSALYQTEDTQEEEQEGAAFCFENPPLFNTRGGMFTVFMADGTVDNVEYALGLSLANYSSVLSGLRRQNYVFAKVVVGNETLDVLAGLKVLDRQTLDDQLFTIVNQADFSIRREFILVDHRSFKRALKAGIKSVEEWFDSDSQPRGFEQATLVRVTAGDEEIRVQASQPFSAGR